MLEAGVTLHSELAPEDPRRRLVSWSRWLAIWRRTLRPAGPCCKRRRRRRLRRGEDLATEPVEEEEID